MIDTNEFKRKVKEWVKANPLGNEQELSDFCEDLIPPAQFASQKWLVDQTLHWYRYVVAQRDRLLTLEEEDMN